MLFFILPVKHDSTVLKEAGRMTDMKNYLKIIRSFFPEIRKISVFGYIADRREWIP